MEKYPSPPVHSDNPLYHDTWQLLKKYRDVIWSLELSARWPDPAPAPEYCERDLPEVGGQVPAGQTAYIQQSRQMVSALNASIDLLRVKHKHGESYYWILYYSFLSPQKPINTEDILDKLQVHIRDISSRTYYRKRREAIDALSAILWGYLSKDNADVLEHFFPFPRLPIIGSIKA